MIKHILWRAFGYKMLLNQDCFATNLHFICTVSSNGYIRAKTLASVTLVIHTQLERGKKKEGGSEGILMGRGHWKGKEVAKKLGDQLFSVYDEN